MCKPSLQNRDNTAYNKIIIIIIIIIIINKQSKIIIHVTM
jgi:hypothetical protein